MAEYHDRDNISKRLGTAETAIATLSASVESIGSDLRDFIDVSRKFNATIEESLRANAAAIAEAKAPRRTDWQTVIFGISLIMAVGVAWIEPLRLRVWDTEMKNTLQDSLYREHEKLELHPVGRSRVDAMEKKFDELSARNKESITELGDRTKAEIESMARDGSVMARESLVQIAVMKSDIEALKKQKP